MIKKLVSVFLSLTLFCSVVNGPFVTASDLYKNWEELEANEVEGTDYLKHYKANADSSILHIAIHGGGIEPGTSELAQEVSDNGNVSDYYELDGIKPSGNLNLHIDSRAYDEPTALNMVRDSFYTVAYHGYYENNVSKTLIGGRDIKLRDAIHRNLKKAGFNVEIAPSQLDGNDPNNICNRNQQEAGVQLELSTVQRRVFFEGGDLSRNNRINKTKAFYDYTNAVKKALNIIKEHPQ